MQDMGKTYAAINTAPNADEATAVAAAKVVPAALVPASTPCPRGLNGTRPMMRSVGVGLSSV